MNLLILIYYVRIAKGYFLPLQDPIPTNTNKCPCGITCFVTNPDCQPCFGSNSRPRSPPVVQLPQGALADYSQYNPQPMLRLTQTYDLLTPPPPVSIPVLKQPALIMVRDPQTEPNWSIPPLYTLVQVPPSNTRTESNGRAAVERFLFEETKSKEPLIQLHVAEATSTSPPEESTTINTTTSTSITSAPLTIPVDENDVELFHQEQTSSTTGTTSTYPTTQDLEDEQPFTPTLELDPEDARTATTTMDPIEGLLAAWSGTTTMNSLVAVFSELTGVHKDGIEHQHNTDDASIAQNTVDTHINSGFEEVTTSLQSASEKSVELEKTDIELFQTTHSIRDYFGTTPRVIPSTTASDISNEIETMSAPVNQPGAPPFVPSEDDISGPMSELKGPQPSFRMQMPTAPPCSNKKTLTVFTGYKTESATTPAFSSNGTIRGHSFSKPTKLHDELGKRFYRKHRESGKVGKQQQVASGRETAHKAHGTSKQLRQQMGTSLFRYKAKTRPKCNSVELKRLMEERMTLSTSASKQMVFSGARLIYPGRIVNVICSRHSFSYIVVTSPVYCEHRKGHLTCFTFLQP